MPRKPPVDLPDDHHDDADRYRRRKARIAKRDREESAAGKEIGEIHRPANLRRRNSCRTDLRRYLTTYHGESFGFPFSPDHDDFIRAVELATLKGGAAAIAMPRGSGKTTIILCACCWAIAYGHRRFLVLIGAEQEAADELGDEIRTIWETNDLLAADFPEIATPIRALEGVVNRAKAQTCNGRQTFMRWSGSKLVFPTVYVSPKHPAARPDGRPGPDGLVPSIASGSVLRCRGLLSRLRGLKATTPAGETIRPDLVLVEDFQTDASAKSDTQCATRERTIAGAVLGLAGPGKKIAAFATCTVIRLGDAADRILNRKLYPRWHGRRCRIVNAWPEDHPSTGETARKHWEAYQDLRATELETGDETHPKATAYYRRHRAAMDAGSDVPWAARKYPHELSALEHAQNLRHDNPDTFEAEYQNSPRDTAAEAAAEIRLLRSDDHITNQSDTRRHECPLETQWLTVGVDVQKTLLYWAISAVADDFSGTVIDYGTWPEQTAPYFTLSDAELTLQKWSGLHNETAAIRQGLDALVERLASTVYTRTDGLTMQIDRGLVDAGYQTATVYRWAAATAAPYLPAMGFGVTARQTPWDRHKRQRGERLGHFWRIPSTAKTKGVRRVDIDTNTWKTTLLPRFAFPAGELGGWRLYRRPAVMHRLIGDHLASEYPILTRGQGRELYEWARRPNAENHLLDAVIYSAVAANMAGATLAEEITRGRKPAPKRATAGPPTAASKATPDPGRLTLAQRRALKRAQTR